LEVTNKPSQPNYEYRVGLFTVIALIIVFWGWSWLKDISLRPPQRFMVKFHDIAGLTKNAPVQVNGVRVGTVEKIELRGAGQVLCSLRIPVENTIIPQGSLITIQTLGLVGAKYVEITLPKQNPDEPTPPPIEPDSVVVGQDPVRAELYVNRIAANFAHFSDCFADLKAREGLTQAARDSGAAIDNIKEAAAKFNVNMDRLSEATTDIRHGAVTADGFFAQGKSTMEKISGMASEWQNTGRKINHLLVDEPGFNSNLKQTVELARETANKVQEAVHELNSTLSDKGMRGDIMTMLNKLTNATENINQSMQVVRQIADDKGLRSDLKEAMSNAKDAMNKANEVLSNPNFITDAQETMADLRAASAQVSKMAQNINKLLGKKHPLLHMMFGAASSGSEKTSIETSSVKKKAKEGDDSSAKSIENESSYKKTTTSTKTSPAELDVNSADNSSTDQPAQMHGEIK